jgi:hypothetical protein
MLKFETGDANSEQGEFDYVSFTLGQGEDAGRVFQAEFDVCSDPTCPCDAMEWHVKAVDDPVKQYEFTINIQSRALDETTINDSGTQAFAERVVAGLSAQDWEELEDVFYSAKADLSEEFEIESSHPHFPSHKEGIHFYDDVLPFSQPFLFTHQGREELVASDSYYVISDNDAGGSEAHLLFHPQVDGDEMDEDAGDSSYITVDYREKKILNVEKGCPRLVPEQLLAEVTAEYPDFWERLEKRHQNLQSLFWRFLKASPLKPAVSSKIAGRNDPCPCGSGKKYKKCCAK